MLTFDATQPRVTNVKTPIKGFHVGDACIKKLMPMSKRSIGHHVKNSDAAQLRVTNVKTPILVGSPQGRSVVVVTTLFVAS